VRVGDGNTAGPAGVHAVMTTIGLIGSGHIGGTLARLAVENGYDVVVSNSRGPETLTDLVAELGDRARAGTAQEAAEAGDVVVVTIPLAAYRTVPVEPLAGKVVIDTTNYYWQRDGHIAELDAGTTTSSRLIQEHLPRSLVVKAFNHITAADLGSRSTPAGTPGRRALVVASDHDDAKARVGTLLDELGFDAVDAGTLADSWRIEPGTPGYGPDLDADGLRAALADATRGAAA
jgi:predicted dinucleotide-binding enzyme